MIGDTRDRILSAPHKNCAKNHLFNRKSPRRILLARQLAVALTQVLTLAQVRMEKYNAFHGLKNIVNSANWGDLHSVDSRGKRIL
jgi:hypothetical protein